MSNITIVTPFFWPQNNGVANYVKAISEKLVALGYSITIVTGGSDSEEKSNCNIKIIRLDVSGGFNLSSPIKGDWRSIPDVINDSHPSVVICHCAQTWATDVPLLFVNRINAPVVYHSHCISTGYINQGKWVRSIARYLAWIPYRFFQKRLLKRSAGALFLSNEGNDGRCKDFYWLTQKTNKPTKVVGAGFNPIFDQIPDIDGQDLYVLSVLDATPLKGFDSVLRSFRLSGVSSRYKLMLYVHKMTSWAQSILKAEIRRGLDINSVVIKEGERPDSLITSYKDARCFISASRTECLPLVLVDCVGAGVPFIALRTGHVESLPGGIFCRDVFQLAEELALLCAQGSARHRGLRHELLHSRDRYSWLSVANRHIEFFQKLTPPVLKN